jgi:hypothetical protein
MEVTQRENIGEDLEAPVARGARAASHTLVPELRFGDVVLHYKSNAEAILGASLVIGNPEPATTYWAAHDLGERKANVLPAWLEGVRVPIDHWVAVDPPVTLTELRSHEKELMAIRDDLQRRYPEAALYFPWIRYGSGSAPMRTQQSYLVKFPQAAIDVIPRLRTAVNTAQAALVGRVAATREVELAEAAVADAAGRGGGRRGQGFLGDQKIRVVLEVHAMNGAIRHYREGGWTVTDAHGIERWDLECIKAGTTMHVTVKGITGGAEEIVLTPDEVSHAQSCEAVALFILSEISVFRDAAGAIAARGGKVLIYEPWIIEDGTLAPIGYKYSPPTN